MQLSKRTFFRCFRMAMRAAGHHNYSDFGGHAFRVGGVVAMQEAGASAAEVMAQGRWRSDTWRIYCRRGKARSMKWCRAILRVKGDGVAVPAPPTPAAAPRGAAPRPPRGGPRETGRTRDIVPIALSMPRRAVASTTLCGSGSPASHGGATTARAAPHMTSGSSPPSARPPLAPRSQRGAHLLAACQPEMVLTWSGKPSKTEYITDRLRRIDGLKIAAVSGRGTPFRVLDRHGKPVRYRRADLRYDLASGLLSCGWPIPAHTAAPGPNPVGAGLASLHSARGGQ